MFRSGAGSECGSKHAISTAEIRVSTLLLSAVGSIMLCLEVVLSYHSAERTRTECVQPREANWLFQTNATPSLLARYIRRVRRQEVERSYEPARYDQDLDEDKR